MTHRIRATSLPRLCAALVSAILFLAPPAGADRLVLNSGKTLEGIIEKEYPTSVHIRHEGRLIRIYRDRIGSVEKETPERNVELLTEKIDISLTEGDVPAAREFLRAAREIAGEGSEFDGKFADFSERISNLESRGTSRQRREYAGTLLNDAIFKFDRIETQKGIELLLQALEADPGYERAHEQMSDFIARGSDKFLNNPRILGLAGDYLCDRVDPTRLPDEHAISEILPAIFTNEYRSLAAATDEEQIQSRARRVRKIASAYESHPVWLDQADEDTREILDLGGDGIILRQVDDALSEGEYQKALARMQVLGEASARPEYSDRYIRIWIGLEEFDRALILLEASKEYASDPTAVERSVNALGLFAEARKAMDDGEHRQARGLLERLYTQRENLLPEIFTLVADAKVGYDLQDMDFAEGNQEYTRAADIAVQVFRSARDETSRDTARETFERVRDKISFKFDFAWELDGTPQEAEQAWTDATISIFGALYEMKFDPLSPFSLRLDLSLSSTTGGAGARAVAARSQPAPHALTPPVAVSGLVITLVGGHALMPRMMTLTEQPVTLPAEVIAEREAARDTRHVSGQVVFADLASITDFGTFLGAGLLHYLPADRLTGIGRNMQLKR